MFKKYELFGFGISILLMAVALFLTQVDSTSNLLNANQSAAVGSVIVDGDVTENPEEVGNALRSAATADGRITQLVIDDVVIGTGDAIENGDTVTVNYIGRLQNGQEFDNSYQRGEPFTFTVGAGRVIQGWERGVIGMQEGGQRILVIPASLGYGADGYGPIPGGATLVFAIEVLAIE